MTIKKVELIDQILYIDVDSSGYYKGFIDTLDNIDNLYSADPVQHSYCFGYETPKSNDAQEPNNVPITVGDNQIMINLSDFNPELDTSAFVVTIEGSQYFYYDQKEVYLKSTELLVNHCSTCLDKHQKERIMLLALKLNLLQYAMNQRMWEDSINYYIDIARMLNIDFKYNAKKALHSSNCKHCIKCFNNCCTLC